MLTKQEVINEVRTLTFRVAFKAADYESALKPEVWPYRVAVRHYRAPKRDRAGDGSWQGQSTRSGGQINPPPNRRHNVQQGGQPNTGAAASDHHGNSSGYLPPGHPGRVRQNQQMMGKVNPGPVELRNFFTILSALNGEMGPNSGP